MLCTFIGLPAAPSDAASPSLLDPSFGTAGVTRIDTGGSTIDVANSLGTGNISSDSGGVIAGSANGNLAFANPSEIPPYGSKYNDGRVTFDFGRPSSAHAIADGTYGLVAAGSAADDLALAAVGRDSAPDRSFGTEGMVTTSFGGPTVARALISRGDGYLVAGEAQVGAGGSMALAQYDLRGELRSWFGDGGKTVADLTPGADAARAILVLPNAWYPDASYLVVGQAGPGMVIAGFASDGRLDPSFGVDGRIVLDISPGVDVINAIALADAAGNRFLVAGSAGGTPFVGRFLRDGTPDPTFGAGGIALLPIDGSFEGFTSVTGTGNDRVKSIGAAGRVRRGDAVDVVVARFTLDGRPDIRFAGTGSAVVDLGGRDDRLAGTYLIYKPGADPYAELGTPTFVVMGSDGRDFVKAFVDESGRISAPQTPSHVAPLQAIYRLDVGTPTWDGGSRVARQPDGRLIVAGSSGNGLLLTRLQTDGTRDSSFHRGQPAIREVGRGSLLDLQVQPDGKILVLMRQSSGLSSFLLRFLPSGELDWTLGYRGQTPFEGFWLPGGERDLGRPQNTPVVNHDPRLATRLPGGRWAALLEDASDPLDFRTWVFVYKADGYLDPAFGTGGIAKVSLGHHVRGVDLLAQPDGRIIVVLSAMDSNGARTHLLRLFPDGRLDPSFGGTDIVTIPQLPGVGSALLGTDGSIVLAGGVGDGHGGSDALIVRYRPGRPILADPKLQMPYSIWEQPTTTPLDGIGSWVINANTPTAGSGQARPTYIEGHVFNFSESPAQGVVSLVTDPAGRFVTFSASGPDGTPHGAAIPFQWEGGRAYFTYVYQLAPGTWGAWIYDNTAAAWTEIGVLYLPQQWGKLSAVSVTTLAWYGPSAGRCAAYPRADVSFYPPVGYVGGSATIGRFLVTGAVNDDCLAETSMSGAWARYRVGADS